MSELRKVYDEAANALRVTGSGGGGGTPDDNSVTTAKIVNDAVTYAKIQNVTATDKVLGRSTSGAGDVEEIAMTAAGRALVDDADAAAQRTTLGLGTAATMSATAGGDLSGTLPSPTVAKINGITISGTPNGSKFLRDDGVWTAPSAGSVAADAIFDAKGDLAVGTGADTAAKLTVGTFGQVAKADSSTSTGMIYGHSQGLANAYLKPTGAIAETYPRVVGYTNQGPLTSGQVSLFAIGLPKNQVVTSITFVSLTTAASPTHWWFSLCDNTYTTLRSTADQLTGAWGANTQQTVNLSSTFTTAYEGLYYLGIMVTGTVPSLTGQLTAASNNVAFGIAPIICVNGNSSLTTAPSDGTLLASAPTAKTTNVWAYCS